MSEDNPLFKILDDGAKREQARSIAWQAQSEGTSQSGFVDSAVSSFAELFGQQPTPQVEAYRMQNPVGGLVSELVSPIGWYGAAFKLSKVPKGAKMLDRGMDLFGKYGDDLSHPVTAGIIRETLRFSPAELGRLAGGLAIPAEEQDWGRLFADVGISTLLTGGVGMLSGMFTGAGKVISEAAPRVVGAEVGLRPTFQMRMALDEGAEVVGAPRSEAMQRWQTEVFKEELGKNDTLFRTLAGAEGDADRAAVESLFRVQSNFGKTRDITRRMIFESDGRNRRSINAGEQQQIIDALGFKSADELAANTIMPRMIQVNSEEGAGALKEILDRGVWSKVDNGVFMARDEETGLSVVLKRIERSARTPSGQASRAKAAQGDKYFLAATDRPNKFAPTSAKLTEMTMAQWAKLGPAFAPRGNSMLGKAMDQMMDILSPIDYQDIAKGAKGITSTSIYRKAAQRLGESASLKQAVDWAYDVSAPRLFLEQRDALYGRLSAVRRYVFRTTDEITNRMIYGDRRLAQSVSSRAVREAAGDAGWEGYEPFIRQIQRLRDDEVNLIARAAQTQTPGESLEELIKDSIISDEARNFVRSLQEVNRKYIDQVVVPALKEAGEDIGQYNFLEGYIMPRVFQGDYRVRVWDEKGREVWLASGRTGKAAAAEANAIVREAAEQGRKFKTESPQLVQTMSEDGLNMEDLLQGINKRLGDNASNDEIVRSAMRKLNQSTGRNLNEVRRAGPPGTLANERTGRRGSADTADWTKQDFIHALEHHYRQLGRYAGYKVWRGRFESQGLTTFSRGRTQASALGMMQAQNELAYKNLMGKAHSELGISGPVTKTIENVLEPLLGPLGGKNAATKIARTTNEIMYHWNLALLNPTFAVLNALTPIQTVMPWVSMITRAPTEEVARIMQFGPAFDASGRVVGRAGLLHPFKVMKEAMLMLRNPSDELVEHSLRASRDGGLQAQMYETWYGEGSTAINSMRDAFESGSNGVTKYLNWARYTSTLMAKKSEEFSRTIAFNAAWYVGKHNLGLTGETLYQFARRGVEATMYSYGVADRSRMFTGPVGSMFGLFKNWQMHFIGTMFQYAGLGFKHNTWTPFLWQNASALALGGLGATPLVHLADGLAKWYGDAPSSFLWMEENWDQGVSDAVYFGLPSFLGVSLQASSSIPGTDVRNEIGHLGNFVILERMRQLGQALGTAWQVQTEGGTNFLNDPNVRDQLMSALAPRAMFRVSSALEGDYIRSMRTGYPQVRGLSPAERMLHGMGFNVVDVEQQQTAAKQLFSDQQAQRDIIQAHGRLFAQAQLAGNFDEMNRIVQRATLMGWDLDAIMRSADTISRREQESDSLSRFEENQALRYRQAFEN